MKKILYLTSNYPRWKNDATTPFIKHLAEDIHALGDYTIDILAPHAPGAKEKEETSFGTVYRFPYILPKSKQTLCYNGGALSQLKKNTSAKYQIPFFAASEFFHTLFLNHKNKYDLFHAHWMIPQGFIGSLTKKITKTPLITTIHGGDAYSFNNSFFKKIKKYTLDASDEVSVNSHYTQNILKTLTSKTPHLIPMGAEEPNENTKKSASSLTLKNYTLCFIGRFVEEKGILDLIEALEQTDPSIHAILIGDGPLFETIQKRIYDKNLTSRITLTGWLSQEDVLKYLIACDLFVGPSKKSSSGWVESQGLTFSEALLCKTPVIATDSGGISDTIIHKKTGLLSQENNIQSLKEMIEYAYTHQEEMNFLAETGYTHAVTTRTRKISAKNFNTLYKSVLEKK